MSRLKEQESLSPAGVSTTPPLRVESQAFTGSLATLFHLARDCRVDLVLIPLAPVCEAYIQYIEEMEEGDVDSAGAALLALAYLVERKAWALLPIADPPPPQELPELPEPTAHEYASVTDSLEEMRRRREQLFFRAVDQSDAYELPLDLGSLRADDLARVFERLMDRAVPDKVVSLNRPRPSLAEVMRSVVRQIRRLGAATIDDVLPEAFSRLDVVFTFLAVLELLRIGQIKARIADGEVVLRGAEA
ncbi:MAG TPA: segregation/condensation protein A [Fimbriimonadales bacterium]|jgi:segregation and condensation protein A|nr:segregation/condensation protein A [Fimbriimonadales bacterium]